MKECPEESGHGGPDGLRYKLKVMIIISIAALQSLHRLYSKGPQHATQRSLHIP